jgi:hypothetical protein
MNKMKKMILIGRIINIITTNSPKLYFQRNGDTVSMRVVIPYDIVSGEPKEFIDKIPPGEEVFLNEYKG